MTTNPEKPAACQEPRGKVGKKTIEYYKGLKIEDMQRLTPDEMKIVAEYHEDDLILWWLYDKDKEKTRKWMELQQALIRNENATLGLLKHICNTTRIFFIAADLHTKINDKFGETYGECGMGAGIKVR